MRNRNLKIVLLILSAAAVIYIIASVLFYSFEEKLIMYHRPIADDFEYSFDIPFEEITIKPDSETVLKGLHFSHPESNGAVIYFRSSGAMLKNIRFEHNPFYRAAKDIYVIDHRANGKSRGSYNSFEDFKKDAESIYQYVNNVWPSDKIICYSISFGAGQAAWIASQHPVGALVIVSGYFSFDDLLGRKFAWVPFGWRRFDIPVYRYVEEAKCPVLFLHGELDNSIDKGEISRIKEYLGENDELYFIKNAGHTNLTARKEFGEKINQFIQKNGL